jgi:predicted MFS family arabinose efflux permease
MTTRQLKTGYFAITALNTLATTWFLDYLFFYFRDRFGFGNRENLWVSALHGFVYMFAAWQCGKFAQRRGFFASLKLGFAGMALIMAVAALLNSPVQILCALVGYTVMLLFTWPALEALVSENETQAGVQHNVGIYNCVWAAAAAVAYLTGGQLYDLLGRGLVFWIPAGMFAAQFLAVVWLAKQASLVQRSEPRVDVRGDQSVHHPEDTAFHQPIPPKTFLKMAWLANPFSYVAINTVFAVMPGIAQKLGLSPTRVGLFCSTWMFARLASFALLWQWRGWHYRFRGLLLAFVMLIAGFVLLLLAPQLWLVVLAQVFFGFGTGHIYYSSLFYSMDVGEETQAEHGGLHEATVGAGIFAGPAVGAAALQYFPVHSDNGVFAVSILLLIGLAGLITLRIRK